MKSKKDKKDCVKIEEQSKICSFFMYKKQSYFFPFLIYMELEKVDKAMKEKEILHVLPREIRGLIEEEGLDYRYLQEIKLDRKTAASSISWRRIAGRKERRTTSFVTREEMREMMEYISDYSLYAYEEEMKQGFITYRRRTSDRNDRTGNRRKWEGENLKYISSIKVRMSHEILGAQTLFYRISPPIRICIIR